MGNLVPISWDTDAIETNSLAIDVTERLFPEYVKDVVKLGFGRYLWNIFASDVQFFTRYKPSKIRVYTHARSGHEDL